MNIVFELSIYRTIVTSSIRLPAKFMDWPTNNQPDLRLIHKQEPIPNTINYHLYRRLAWLSCESSDLAADSDADIDNKRVDGTCGILMNNMRKDLGHQRG